MATEVKGTAAAYVEAANSHNPAAFIALFADSAVVQDVGREIRGISAIREWANQEIFSANVTFDVRGFVERGTESIVTAVIDGNFPRAGLPDPLVMDLRITTDGDKIVRLHCDLAAESPGS